MERPDTFPFVYAFPEDLPADILFEELSNLLGKDVNIQYMGLVDEETVNKMMELPAHDNKKLRVLQILQYLSNDVARNKIELPKKMFTEPYETVRYPSSAVKTKDYSGFGVAMEELVAFTLFQLYDGKFSSPPAEWVIPEYDASKIAEYFSIYYPLSIVKKVVWGEEFCLDILSSEGTSSLTGHPDFVFHLDDGTCVIFDCKVFAFSKRNSKKKRAIRLQLSCYISLARNMGLVCNKVGIIMPWLRDPPVVEYSVERWNSELLIDPMILSTQRMISLPEHRMRWDYLLMKNKVGSHIRKEAALNYLTLSPDLQRTIPPWQVFLYGNNPSAEQERIGRKSFRESLVSERIALTKSFMNDEVATDYFNRLKKLNWVERAFGRGRKLPRLTYKCCEGESEVLDELANLIEEKFNAEIMGVWCNYYRNGNDWTPEHQDSYGGEVYTLSFGDARDIYFKRISTGEKTKYTLENGDLFYFNKELNDTHKHCVPKTKLKGERISVVFFCTSKPSLQTTHFKNFKAFIHAPYNLNLARDEDYIFEAMGKYLKDAKEFGFKGVVFHVGHHSDPEIGRKIMKRNIKKVLDIIDFDSPLLLETPCGAKNELLPTPEEFISFVSEFPYSKVRVCLDTCHVFVGGYDPLDYIERFGKYRGRIQLIHFNGSRKEKGCRSDGHQCVTEVQSIPDEQLEGVLKFAERFKVPCLTE